MLEQGYDFKENIFYQDNTSAMRLAASEFGPKSEQSRHINIKYFFMKDIVKNKGIKLTHCWIEEMVADFFTKPLQGGLFKVTRKYIIWDIQACQLRRVLEIATQK